jgi:hypothetical protein
VRRGARPAIVALAAVLAGGCGGDPVEPAFKKRLQTATCADWKAASPQARQSAVDRLELVVRGPNDVGKTLPDDLAYSTLDARCKADFARGFLLYELYIRAAAFGPPE